MKKLILLFVVFNTLSCSSYELNSIESRPEFRKEMYGKHAGKFPKHNLVFTEVVDEDLDVDEMYFVVEIAKSEARKFEMRTATGSVIVDRKLCPRQVLGKDITVETFPVHYGFVPGRFNIDGDPIDMLVFGADKKYQGMVKTGIIVPQKVEVIGLLKMEECSAVPCRNEKDWKQDWKIVAVHDDDKEYDIDDISELAVNDITKLVEFFSSYKGAISIRGKKYPQTRVTGQFSKEETLKFINEKFERKTLADRELEIKNCHDVFYDRVVRKNFKQKKDKSYLKCVQRVPYKHFFPDSPFFQDYMSYTTYQYLKKLKYRRARHEQALKQMKSLKEQKEKHYRYVSYDSPYPGTLKPIFEFVKTKDRNQGCPENFPPQHYEGNPLIQL